ncbi:MAG: hypothetical protein GXY91_08150 [Clostridia bacterium]|nr:hypothetical protein [Clostridia bacterium]
MRELQSKIAYLQGLAEGLELNTSSKEGRILANILDILEDMAEEIIDLRERQIELESYVESIDEDLSDLEDDFYDEIEDEDEDDDELDYFEVECPNCHELVYFESDLVDDGNLEISCPNCETIVFQNGEELDDEEE